MLLQNAGFEFKVIQEIGFSNKELAKENELFAKFENCQSSVFSEIFNHNYLSTSELLQVWIFDRNTKKPIGLSLAVIFDEFKSIYSSQSKHKNKRGFLVGQIHCYIRPEYRGLGLIKETIPVLESFLHKQCPVSDSSIACIVMQDKAYSLAKHTRKSLILPNAITILQQNIEAFDNYLNGFGRFRSYESSDLEPQELESFVVSDFINNISMKAHLELNISKQI